MGGAMSSQRGQAAFGGARLPRHRIGDTSPSLYADCSSLGCCPDATRHSCSHSTHRYSHSRTTHRHSHSRCCCRDRPHGLWELPPRKEHSCGFPTAKVLILSELSENFTSRDGLTPVFLMSSFLGHTLFALRFAVFAFSHCRFAPVFRSRNLGQRLERGHALRNHDFAAEGQTRPDIRARIRRIAIRIRERHTAIRIRVVVAAIDHTAC